MGVLLCSSSNDEGPGQVLGAFYTQKLILNVLFLKVV